MSKDAEKKRPDQILDSLAIAGYRSFGSEMQRFTQFSKINIVIGQNNCGKSNVLRFIHEWLARVNSGTKPTLGDLDRHMPNTPSGMQYGFRMPLFQDDDAHAAALASLYNVPIGSRHWNTLKAIFAAKSALDGHGSGPWFDFNADGTFQTTRWEKALGSIPDNELHTLWQHRTNRQGGNRSHWVNEMLPSLIPPITAFSSYLIPAIRKIGAKGSSSEEFNGDGIIERLVKLQNPSALEQQNKNRFKKIGDFLRNVTDNSRAEIEISHERDTILVHMDGKTLPLDYLGSGIHEVIILAAAATVIDNSVICMEEPELHLNPILQKKLIRYLQANTSNQYFITSHSAALMDTPDAEVYHITLIDSTSRVERVTSDKQRSAVCEDLGYHPSDLLQTNCIIWVEGPSDRIYLNWWINDFDSELVEGIHYSIMFYGGRLASHLSGDDMESFVSDFISLRRLNRRGVIIIDSDRQKKGVRLNDTKVRLRDEFDSGPGHAWVTDGREIENYLDPALLKRIIIAIHPTATVASGLDKYENALTITNRRGEKISASKVKVAAQVVSSGRPDFGRFDLRGKVQSLVAFIHESNPKVPALGS